MEYLSEWIIFRVASSWLELPADVADMTLPTEWLLIGWTVKINGGPSRKHVHRLLHIFASVTF